MLVKKLARKHVGKFKITTNIKWKSERLTLGFQVEFENKARYTSSIAIFVFMKLIINIILFFSLSFQVLAQEHISWTAKYDDVTHKAILTANLSKGWHIYSQTTDEAVGPVSTQFELKENKDLIVESPMIEPTPIDAYDTNFEGNVKYFEKQVSFEQKIKSKRTTEATYIVTYMICNEEMCLPPVNEIINLMIIK